MLTKILAENKTSRIKVFIFLLLILLTVITATIVIIYNKPNDLETYNDLEVAIIETQKALNLVSENLNKGLDNIDYLSEYQKTKNIIFTP